MLSAAQAETYEPDGVEVCISIMDPNLSEVRLSPQFAAVLRLNFSDITGPSPAPLHVLFSEEHARAIVDFVRHWADADRIVVHCMAGVSRSPGVALGLCDLHVWPTKHAGRTVSDVEHVGPKRPRACR